MKKLFTLASLATLLFSCSENIVETPIEEKLPINISVGVETRANDSAFANGDAAGIYVVNYDGTTAGTLLTEGNQADNTKFTYNGSAWNSDETIYWKDKSTATDFYAYYPYSASVDITAHQFDVKADQSNEANFWASDFLWGKTANVTPTANAVAIQTNHSLSRIIVDVKPGSGFTSATWAAANKSVKICDVKTTATINLATGVATATGNTSEIIPFTTTSNYKAMMVPQTIADDSKLIVVTVDGTEYVYRTGYTFKANTQHNFSITVNKDASSVNVTIGEWNIDSVVNEGTAVEEGAANSELWYTTTRTEMIDIDWATAFGADIISHDFAIKSANPEDCANLGNIIFNGVVESVGEEAFANISDVFCLGLPASVKTIGDGAFMNCALSYIEWGNIESIGDYAFYNMYWDIRITLPESINTIGDYAFNVNTVYFTGAIPPVVGTESFGGNRIYVPKAYVDAYKTAAGWSQYADDIVGYDFNN